jgi:hypothetical protein
MLIKIMTLALLIEALVEVIKWTFQGDMNKWRVIALVSGILITPLAGLDLFAAAGIPLVVPWIGDLGITIGAGIGWILTGALICRGSGVVNNLIAAISKIKDTLVKPVIVQATTDRSGDCPEERLDMAAGGNK